MKYRIKWLVYISLFAFLPVSAIAENNKEFCKSRTEESNRKEIIEKCSDLAEKGDPNAQYWMGRALFDEKDGVNPHWDRAKDYFKNANKNGYKGDAAKLYWFMVDSAHPQSNKKEYQEMIRSVLEKVGQEKVKGNLDMSRYLQFLISDFCRKSTLEYAPECRENFKNMSNVIKSHTNDSSDTYFDKVLKLEEKIIALPEATSIPRLIKESQRIRHNLPDSSTHLALAEYVYENSLNKDNNINLVLLSERADILFRRHYDSAAKNMLEEVIAINRQRTKEQEAIQKEALEKLTIIKKRSPNLK